MSSDYRNIYDVVVIGGGPGGAAAAYHCARAGLGVLVVDRASFPRDKTCGDALTPAAVGAIRQMGVELPVAATIRGVRTIHLPTQTSTYEDYVSNGSGPGVVVRRLDLDQRLLGRAREAGAEVRLASARRIVPVDHGTREVVLDAGGAMPSVRARNVVLACGAAAGPLLAACEQARERPAWGVAGRMYVETATPVGRDLEFYVSFYNEGRPIPGYTWVFPVTERVANVGVGIYFASGRATSLKTLTLEFLCWLVQEDERFKHVPVALRGFSSAPLRLVPYDGTRERLLPVGDAAGFAHPLSGEGIAYAVESGALAARTIVESCGDDAAAPYAALGRDRFARQRRLGPDLDRIYRHSGFVLGRGWDLLIAPHRTVGDSLRRLFWDKPRRACESSLPAWAAEHVSCVRSALLDEARSLRPLSAEMLADFIDGSHSDFGWYTAFAQAIRAGARSARALSPDEVIGLTVVEMAALVRELHSDLLPVGHDHTRQRLRTWGRNTFSLILADGLNTRALRLLYRIDVGACKLLAGRAHAAMRNAAVHSQSANEESDRIPLCDELLHAAAIVGLGYTKPSSIDVAEVARAFASATCTRDSLTDLSPRSRSMLLDLMARYRRLTTSGGDDLGRRPDEVSSQGATADSR